MKIEHSAFYSQMAKILFCLLSLLIISLIPSSHMIEPSVCKKTTHPPTNKPKVALVHGFTSGGWAWFKVRFILESLGYNVTAIDLKASGIDLTNISEIDTFEQYNEPLDRFMASLDPYEKVVVVAHSAGGVSLTKTLLDHPHKVLVAIYVAATMLKSGYLTCEDLQIGAPHFSESKCNATCPKLPEPSCFQKILIGLKDVPQIFQTEELTLMKSLVRPGPYRALLATNFTYSTKKGSRLADRVPRVYIKTLLDKTLKPEQQSAMIEHWPPCEVHEVFNDHNIPFVNPVLLAALIVNATSYKRVW